MQQKDRMIQLSKITVCGRKEDPFPSKLSESERGIEPRSIACCSMDMDKADLIAITPMSNRWRARLRRGKVQLGRSSTHGLGTGGDPELGYQAAIESADEILKQSPARE